MSPSMYIRQLLAHPTARRITRAKRACATLTRDELLAVAPAFVEAYRAVRGGS